MRCPYCKERSRFTTEAVSVELDFRSPGSIRVYSHAGNSYSLKELHDDHGDVGVKCVRCGSEFNLLELDFNERTKP